MGFQLFLAMVFVVLMVFTGFNEKYLEMILSIIGMSISFGFVDVLQKMSKS